MNYGSKLVEDAVRQFSTLPGIGKKTALRLVLHLLKKDTSVVEEFSGALLRMKAELKKCITCMNISDAEECSICLDSSRNKRLICVVESIRDIMAIEDTQQFNGTYHVLGGLISPLEGVGPDDLYIGELVDRIRGMEEKPEILLALSPTIDGETTSFFLFKQLEEFELMMSQISRGISFGGELEYADEITLGRSIASRLPYQAQGFNGGR